MNLNTNHIENKSSGLFLGNESYGWAEKEVYGNQDSNKTIAIITGVHPRESEFHNATAAALNDKTKSLSKKYILYKIHVTKNPLHFTIGRMNGQLIANKIVVPDIIKINPQLVVDIHEDLGKEVGYKYSRFIYPVSKDDETIGYVNNITRKIPYINRYSPGGSSPLYVTKPLARHGISAMVYETYKEDLYNKKYSDASQFIDVLDKL
ncbi:hypothetical protein J2749_001338 [Methanobacterium oryzae]